MKNTNANRFLPLPPTSYKCPFSEEARTCQSNPFDTYLNSLPCPTNGDHFRGFSIDFSDPLNTRGFASASGSLMATFGGASYWNYGPVFGISETPIEAGFSVQDHLHIESAAIFGATGLGAQADILLDEDYEVFRDSFDLEEIIDGFNVSVSPRGGAGFAVFAGVGRGMSVSLGLPSFKEKMQRACDRECR